MLLAALCDQSQRQLNRLASLNSHPAAILEAPERAWRAAGVSPEVMANRRAWTAAGRRHRLHQAALRALDRLDDCQARLLVRGRTAYPRLLEEVYHPPPLLYVAGAVEALFRPQFAIVGSRRCSAGGARAARDFAAGLSAAGFSICSGMALGIDAAAHRAALAAGGPTVAVLGTGIDMCYPRRHGALAAEIRERGALLTELPPGSPPRKLHFPRRNRLISGISVGVLVIEAGLLSGSLITARTALEQNREVFAVPHSIYHPGGRGCLQLLRQGAGLAENLDDLVAAVGALCDVAAECPLREGLRPEPPEPPEATRAVWERLGHEPVDVDHLVACGAGDVATVVASLKRLELEGLVEQTAGFYMRRV